MQGLLKVSPLARTTDTEIFAAGLFRGRTALITGGGTGIGLAIARELGRLGASVVIAARRRDILDGAASELCEAGIDATALTLNIRDELAVEALFEELAARELTVEILVNNAGGQFTAAALDISANGFRAVVDLNLNGTWRMCQAFARRVVARGGSGGRIINIVLSIDRRSIKLRARRRGARRGYQPDQDARRRVGAARHPRQRRGARHHSDERARPV